ncbi:MAG: hypothetical protein B1H09_06945 [Gemmatimonadaceae bacterium 4484_173]|nr:MAG: hypothetical protein B1H09_06945 [Gemmatimonadaceae bacterium 4484_173]RKZ05058.1 MAG: hypothetical protein DRQ21_00875 [Candidatus Fermentibacteria bacterium]
MRSLFVMLVLTVSAFGYGYWDIFGFGGRVPSLSPPSAGMCGASVPDTSSAFSVFTNPSALTGINRLMVSASGWETGWNEIITYHYTCTEPHRDNLGGMIPRGEFAVAFPVWNGISAGAGIAVVSQYDMTATMQVYREVGYLHRELYKTMVTDATGSLNEALVSIAGSLGPVNIGISPGVRFGSGESTTFSNRVSGPDSTIVESWDQSEFALRAGASTSLGYTVVYSSFVSGDSRYMSFADIGVSASFPFLKGGYLGAEFALYDGNWLKGTAFARLPGVVEGSNIYMGIDGYRPEGALKTGLGFSYGGDYTFGNYRFSAAYQLQSRYRDASGISTDYINHVFDKGETVMIGVERVF